MEKADWDPSQLPLKRNEMWTKIANEVRPTQIRSILDSRWFACGLSSILVGILLILFRPPHILTTVDEKTRIRWPLILFWMVIAAVGTLLLTFFWQDQKVAA